MVNLRSAWYAGRLQSIFAPDQPRPMWFELLQTMIFPEHFATNRVVAGCELTKLFNKQIAVLMWFKRCASAVGKNQKPKKIYLREG